MEKSGRQPKKHVAVYPHLARAFSHVARMEGRQLSNLFKEVFAFWLQEKRPGKYEEVDLDEEQDDSTTP